MFRGCCAWRHQAGEGMRTNADRSLRHRDARAIQKQTPFAGVTGGNDSHRDIHSALNAAALEGVLSDAHQQERTELGDPRRKRQATT